MSDHIPAKSLASFGGKPIIEPWEGRYPKIHPSVMISSGAAVIGDVTIGENSSIWYQCALRGDVFPIEVGKRTSIQDLSLLHCRYQKLKCIVGDDCTVGHSVVLHACKVGNFCLIGMGAVILDDAEIGDECIVGAHSLVTQSKKFPPRSMIMGSPAKRVRELNEEELKYIHWSAGHYVNIKNKYPAMRDLLKG